MVQFQNWGPCVPKSRLHIYRHVCLVSKHIILSSVHLISRTILCQLGLVTFLQLDFSFKQITCLLPLPTLMGAAFFIFTFCFHQVCPSICFHQMCSRSLMEDDIDVLIKFLHRHQSPPQAIQVSPQASSLSQKQLTYCHHIGNSTGENPQNKWISHQDQLLCR